MDLEYIDHVDLQCTVADINTVLAGFDVMTEEENDVFEAWWDEKGLPRGLQCVEIHFHASLKEWVATLLTERGMDATNKELRIKVALCIDAMIH